VGKLNLRDFDSPEKAFKALMRRKKEIEKELGKLNGLKEEGRISEEEYEERRKNLEREFVEIMDRLVQIRFLMRR